MNRSWQDFALLGILALLWGSSYPLIKVAVAEIPPLTLIAVRVSVAAIVLGVVLIMRHVPLPRSPRMWRALGVQAFFNSIGAWTLLAWGQQFIDSATAAVLNSTAPVVVFFLTIAYTRHENTDWTRLAGALLGVTGVALIVGAPNEGSDPMRTLGQLAVLLGAVFYAGAAIYGRRFASLDSAATATGTMLWATACLLPAALWFDRPWTLRPSMAAVGSAIVLGTLCTGVALLIYFRLLKTLGSMAVASQAYLRAAVGALLGVLLLGEQLSMTMVIGIVLTLVGVIAINAQRRASD